MRLRAILTGVTISLCTATALNAGDLGPGSLKDTPFAIIPWDWGGFYGGLTAGYGTGDASNVTAHPRHRNRVLDNASSLIDTGFMG